MKPERDNDPMGLPGPEHPFITQVLFESRVAALVDNAWEHAERVRRRQLWVASAVWVTIAAGITWWVFA